MKPLWLHPSADGFVPVVEYLEARIGLRLSGSDIGTVMAVVDGSAIAGDVLFHNYDPGFGTIEISAASDSKRWLTRPILREMFGYAFGQLACQAVVARMDASRKLTRIFTAYGFKRYDVPRLRGRGTVEAVIVLSSEDWQDSKFQKEKRHE